MASCNLSPGNRNILCRNKYGSECDVDKTTTLVHEQGCSRADGELEDDIIVISDDDEPVCSKKLCKCNPYCLNYLGQDMWEDEGLSWLKPAAWRLYLTETAMEKFIEVANLGENPFLSSREPGVPVGLMVLSLFFRGLEAFHLKSPRILVPHAMPTRHCRSSQIKSLSCSSELKAILGVVPLCCFPFRCLWLRTARNYSSGEVQGSFPFFSGFVLSTTYH